MVARAHDAHAAGRVPGGDAVEAAVARLVITQMAGRFIAGHDVADAAETFAGILLPVLARRLPEFGPIFERYAADLKATAEQ